MVVGENISRRIVAAVSSRAGVAENIVARVGVTRKDVVGVCGVVV